MPARAVSRRRSRRLGARGAGTSYPTRGTTSADFPLQRKPRQQIIQPHLRRMPPIEDRLHNLRREQRQPQNAADVGRREAPGGGQVLDRPVHAGIQHPPPPKRPRQHLHHRVVNSRPRRPLRAFRRHRQLPPAAFPKREWDADSDRLLVGRHFRLLHAAALLLPATSAQRPRSISRTAF